MTKSYSRSSDVWIRSECDLMPSTSHNNHNVSTVLADLLACSKCRKNFSIDAHRPVNLSCGHAICMPCTTGVDDVVCEVDQTKFSAADVKDLPLNMAILRLLDAPTDDSELAKRSLTAHAMAAGQSADAFAAVEHAILWLADHFRTDDTAGMEVLSRALQRKLANVLCAQPATSAGSAHMFRALRAVVERMLTELILALQNSSNISSHLWSAVRARGCQFLGPTMQEDVLRLMLSALSKGELIARKALVMYIVRTLTRTYPQVSKTCVGHVVQLAYRASCFNVIKRDGESSLMQLKTEFRDYPSLRHEHDTQIVHIAVEAGLRISPEQWSSLLYGDLRHRLHMQTIVDRISAPQLLANAALELRNVLVGRKSSTVGAAVISATGGLKDGGAAAGGAAKDSTTNGHNANKIVHNTGHNNEMLCPIFDHLKTLEMDEKNLKVDAEFLEIALLDVHAILEIFIGFMKNRSMNRTMDKRPRKSLDHRPTNLYKTRMCRDALMGKYCQNGDGCKYAHSFSELRTNGVRNNNNNNGNNVKHPPPLLSAFDVGSSTTTHGVQRLNADLYVTTGADGSGTVMITNQIDAQSLGVQPMTANVLTTPAACQLASPTVAVASTGAQPSTLLANILDGTMTSLTAGDTILPSAPPTMVGAIDTTTGELVNLIPVHNSQMMTTIEPEDALPTNVMLEPIPLVPLLVQPQPPPIGLDQQLAPSQPPLAAQNIMMPTQSVPVYMAAAGGPPGATLFSIPVGAMSPPNSAGFMMNAALSGNSPANASTVGIVPGLIIGTPPNFCQLADMRPSANILEDFYNDEYEHHVSYTVANSVLFDEKDNYFKNGGGIDLPPLPIGSFKVLDKKVAAPCLYNTFSETLSPTAKVPPSALSTNYLRTACVNPLYRQEPISLATVQSGCKNVTKDAIGQPLIASSLQNINFAPQMNALNSIQFLDALSTVIKPLSDRGVADPQEVVALSIDRIIDVKEHVNDVKDSNDVVASAVKKEQLKVELSVANRQITTLDEQNKESYLLKELKAVDEQIKKLSVVA